MPMPNRKGSSSSTCPSSSPATSWNSDGTLPLDDWTIAYDGRIERGAFALNTNKRLKEEEDPFEFVVNVILWTSSV